MHQLRELLLKQKKNVYTQKHVQSIFIQWTIMS